MWTSLSSSGPLSADPASELDVLGHYGDPLGVNGAEVGVLEETDKVSFTSFLKCHDSRALEPQVGLEVLSDLADQTLEGELANEQLCGLLIPEDLTVRKRRTGFQLAHLLISLRATVPGL